MEQAGLLTSRRVARNVFYAVDAAGLGATIAWLLNDCCMEHPEVVASCRHRLQGRDPAIRPSERAVP